MLLLTLVSPSLTLACLLPLALTIQQLVLHCRYCTVLGSLCRTATLGRCVTKAQPNSNPDKQPVRQTAKLKGLPSSQAMPGER
ncbi:hypothetical protein B0I72DRAFT_138114 [Yarrowia lipolytica]|uniref:Secreted protein n=1 Tax=Yarrowia lipolytica TaxID=4952 RepID=A0A371C7T8_YARLL|nr:hypothetical protein BKA91DRAFT_137243 [Yarrowia lipolytica]KAE8173919.1 hypothetical protein BKA90DRAFT_134875 [Yarrowia lipolytica]RDW26369.1 hypothetical protein B0I71DRAFT_131013 [Yarrowia lipolytica]RDW32425.1 hypothetical protein B0I72DRAFT_138114 [Yarrowia lipolytica]RDW39503.1 hypothetical protein B0I73DRAFT_131908 [Yarrowia lipolytica]